MRTIAAAFSAVSTTLNRALNQVDLSEDIVVQARDYARRKYQAGEATALTTGKNQGELIIEQPVRLEDDQ